MRKFILLIVCIAVAGCGSSGNGMEPRGADNPPTPGTQIDRVGRAAISTATVDTFSGDGAMKNATKDAYNAASPGSWSTFAATIETSLAILDSLDASCGNQLAADLDPEDRYAGLAGVLADDQLYVNSASGTCGVYLGLEAEIVGALEPGEGGCGGRTPEDDIIERSYSVLAAGLLEGIDDTIEENDVSFSSAFPFLAAPQN